MLHTKVFRPLLCGPRPSSPRPSAHTLTSTYIQTYIYSHVDIRSYYHMYVYAHVCTSCLHLYLSIHIYIEHLHVIPAWLIPSHTSSFRHIYRENKLHIYALRLQRTHHYNYTSIAAFLRHVFSHVFYHIFTETFSRIYICTITRCIYIYACTYSYTCAAEALASYSASTLSYMPARCLRSREWQPV